jgi:rhodanese-related sulfurtransferase
VVFLDTRSPEEFNVSHIAGARYVGYKDFDLAAIADIPTYYPIIAYCSIGKRSGEIGKRLADAGFTNVRNMYGGIFEWVNNGFPVVDRQGQPTDSTHTFDKTWSRWLHRGVKVY